MSEIIKKMILGVAKTDSFIEEELVSVLMSALLSDLDFDIIL